MTPNSLIHQPYLSGCSSIVAMVVSNKKIAVYGLIAATAAASTAAASPPPPP